MLLRMERRSTFPLFALRFGGEVDDEAGRARCALAATDRLPLHRLQVIFECPHARHVDGSFHRMTAVSAYSLGWS
jgi:hypothetical protein